MTPYAIVNAFPHVKLSDFIRFSSSPARTLMKGASLSLAWLLVLSSVALASSGPRRGAGRVCDPSALTLRKQFRAPTSYGGPIATRSTRALAGLADADSLLQRGAAATADDDDEAIQNDAPAASIDAAERPSPALEPIGVLAHVCARQPKTHSFSPRCPRGPPVAG
jgi:hypothetical protein